MSRYDKYKKKKAVWSEDDYKDYQIRLRKAIKGSQGEEHPALMWEWAILETKKGLFGYFAYYSYIRLENE